MPITPVRGYAVPLRTKRPAWLDDVKETEKPTTRTSGTLYNFNGHLPFGYDEDDYDFRYDRPTGIGWNNDIPNLADTDPIDEHNIADVNPLGDSGRCFELTTRRAEQCMVCGGWFKKIHSPIDAQGNHKIQCRKCCIVCNHAR